MIDPSPIPNLLVASSIPIGGSLMWTNNRVEDQRRLSNSIGQDRNFGLKEFALGSGFKVSKKELFLIWHYCLVKFWQIQLKKILHPLRDIKLQA